MTARSPAPSPLQHQAHLDGWRGLAITLLLIGHFMPVPGINLGSVGVSLFFVLSGLLMGQLLFVRQTPLPLFYRRRISRIVPAHLAFIGIVSGVTLLGERAFSGSETLAAALFVNNYEMLKPADRVMPFGHIWSLCVEEHSYVVLSLVALLARRSQVSPRWMTAALAAACVACGLAYHHVHSGPALLFGDWLHTEVAAYGILASVFCLLSLRTPSQHRWPSWACPALLVAGIALQWWSVPQPLKTFAGVGALALAVNLLSRAPAWLRSWLSLPALRMLGLWSFSLYLWQQPFYLALHRGELTLPVALGSAFACGLASHYLLERPVRNWLNRAWR